VPVQFNIARLLQCLIIRPFEFKIGMLFTFKIARLFKFKNDRSFKFQITRLFKFWMIIRTVSAIVSATANPYDHLDDAHDRDHRHCR
jgi:hypothetical protein